MAPGVKPPLPLESLPGCRVNEGGGGPGEQSQASGEASGLEGRRVDVDILAVENGTTAEQPVPGRRVEGRIAAVCIAAVN